MTVDNDHLKNAMVLTLLKLPGFGPEKVFRYISKNNYNFNSCLNNVKDLIDDTSLFSDLMKKTADEIIFKEKKGIKLITIMDGIFPKKLFSSDDKCIFLYYMGNLELLNNKSIAVVGTRNPNEPFITKGKEITKRLTNEGFVIVSGLALGCDTIAHEECLDNGGKTIAVLPSSCDSIVPASNKELAMRIVDKGGLLVTEYGSKNEYSKYNNPRRDRIQSFLSDGLIVIQSTDSGGTRFAVQRSIKDRKYVCALSGNDFSLIDEYVDSDEKGFSTIVKNIDGNRITQKKLF